MSGGGRCNVTNAGDTDQLVEAFPGNGKFLYAALTRFSNDDLRTLLAGEGVATRVEDRGRVFPAEGGAKAVVGALERAARRVGTIIHTGTPVTAVALVERRDRSGPFLVTACGERRWVATCLILTPGGASYPQSGTTGDGYRWARALGHAVTPLGPALVALETRETWPKRLRGVALRGVGVAVHAGGRVLAESQGDVLFTHFGLSGPAILDVSRRAAQAHGAQSESEVAISLRTAPEAPPRAWRDRLEERIRENPRRLVKNLFEGWWPASLAEVVCAAEVGVDPITQVAHLPGAVRERLAALLAELVVHLERPRPLAEAMVTAGGVSLAEVDPRTMESRLVPGLYFAGEMLDLDAVTGGYNLQAAFSTGWLAGDAAARSLGDTRGG